MKILSNLVIVIIFGFAGAMFGLGLIPQISSINQSQDITPVATTSTPQPAPAENSPEPVVKGIETEQVTEPQTLSIPKLGVNAAVEAVGQDSTGRMDVPQGVFNVGWYSLGYKPGEKGNAVMAGHLDTTTGAPAVFYYLNQLSVGDQVIVSDRNGRELTFEVTGARSYLFDQVPLQEIFGPSDKPRLNLITCTGVWNRGTSNYTNRLVVFTELRG